MPILTRGGLKAGGPLLEVAVGLTTDQSSARAQSAQPPVYPEVIHALIDSGAAMSVLANSVVERLGLEPAGEWTTRTASTEQGGLRVSFYNIELRFGRTPELGIASSLRVTGLPLAGFDARMLLGRDVLARCAFIYNGSDDRFTIAY